MLKTKIKMEKIESLDNLKNIVQELKKKNKSIVTTNGIFDILHIGHIRYLKQAKKLGDVLIIALNSDSSTKKIKGPKRPLNNEKDRAEALAALECVDYIAIFNEENPIKTLEKIKPNIHVKGGDYKMDQIIEKSIVEKNKGKVVLIPEVKGYSTTDLINRIVESHKDK